MPSHQVKIYFNNISPATHKASKWSPFLRFLHQKPVCTSSPYVPCAPPISWFRSSELVRGKILSYSLRNFFQSTFTSSLLGPYIFLGAPFSNTFNLCSSHNVRNYFSHTYKTTGKHLIVYILIFTFLASKRKDKILRAE